VEPNIDINMTTYIDPETGIPYWSVAWKFTHNEKQYGSYMLKDKDSLTQSECLKLSVDQLLEQAMDVYELLIKEK
jgi:formiminotetrahydrofolate cyclodeaminase